MPNYVMFNIKMVKGDTESFGFEIEGIENLDAAYFSCKRNSQDENYLFQKSLNSGITQRVENQYVVRIDPDDTALLDPGQYWYDLEISKNGDIFTIFRGVLELLPEITTPTGDININTSWGRITGNINNQSDLQLEFQTKADVSSLSTVATTGLYSDLTGTPNLASVATTGSYNDLLNKPSIPTKTSDLTNDSNFVASTSLATVATTGAYSDLTGTPNLATVAISGSYADLTNKPNLATVATTGSYSDLSNKPSIPTKTSDLTNDSNFVASTSLAAVATTGDYSDLSGTPNLATVATSGSYADLSNKPNLSTVATSGLYSDLSGTPNLAAVATSGSYTDLTNKPSIPTKTSDLTNDSNFVASTSLATVATSGAYSDLTGTPNLATVATSGSYADLTNKPSIPTKTSDLTNDSNFVASTSLATVATTGAYSDLTGTPSLAAVATSGSYADLSNTPNLATVATTGAYSDLTGTPNLATVATSGLATDLSGVLPIANGGTGASTVADARINLGFKVSTIYENSSGATFMSWSEQASLHQNTFKFGFFYKVKATGSSAVISAPGMKYVEFPVKSDGTSETFILEAVRMYDTTPTLTKIALQVSVSKNVIYTMSPANITVSWLQDSSVPSNTAKIENTNSSPEYSIAIFKVVEYTY